jgi:hypothetical protein
MPDADASLAAAGEAQKVVAHLNGEGSQGSSPNPFQKTPFHAAAEAEAADDALVGIQRSPEWISARVKELYKEALNREPKDDNRLPEFIHRKDLPSILAKLDRDEVDHVAQKVYNEIISIHYTKAEAAARETISREAVIVEEFEKRVAVIKAELNEKSHQDRLKTNRATLTFLRSAMLVLLIPILGMLPGSWRFFQLFPLIVVVWLNWKPFMAVNKMMRDLQKESIKPQD